MLSLLIVSREILGIQQQRQIKWENYSELRHKDIESLVRIELRHLHTLPDFTEEFGEQIRGDILEHAQGTFLWAGYALRECRKARSCIDVKSSLKDVPDGLHQVYRKAVSNSPQQNRVTAEHILTWVALARGDVSFKILAQAADIDPDPSLGLDAAVAARVRDCEPLVKTNRDQIVTLGHASVRDFLVVRQESESNKWEDFTIFDRLGYLNIARTCIQQFEASELRRDKCLHHLYENTMLAYAIQRWPEHARLAGDKARDLLLEFDSFFVKGPVIRKSWWKTYELHYTTPFAVMPALQKACYFGIKPWVMKLLTDRRSIFTIGHRVNEHSWSGATPLSCAIAGGHQDTVDFLLDARRATVDGTSWFTRAGSLQFAAAHGRTHFVKQLLDSEFKKRAWVNAKRATDGTTALHLAAQAGHDETLLFLLKQGADRTVLNFSWETPLHLAAASGQGTEIIFPLVDPDRSKITDIETRSWYGHTALTEAARRGWKDTVLALLKAGANVNGRDSHTRTPLHMAAVNGSMSTAKCLVENDADINAMDDNDAKPVHYAAKYSKPELVKFFLDTGNSLEEEDHIRQNLFHCAAARGNTDVIKLLHHLGLDVNKVDRDGDTPLHHAASGGNHVDAHRALCEAGVDVNAVNKTDGRTAYLAYLGVSHKTENEAYAKKVATIHFEYGADFTITDNKKKSAVDYARKKGHKDLAAFLMKPTHPEPKEEKDADSRYETRNGERADVVGAEDITVVDMIAEDITAESDEEQKASEVVSLGWEAEIEGQSLRFRENPRSHCEGERETDLEPEQPTEEDVLTLAALEGKVQKGQAA